MSVGAGLADAVVRWQRSHGRHALPWQNTQDPYRVWLSEIMLQQTQVATVIGYYARFLERFPNVVALAAGSEDEVLALWSGLGYYSRARNLHRAAQAVVELHQGAFPPSAEALATLPGIGRSTAAAIAAFCYGERVPILDANVRRVLSRYLGFGEDLARPANERVLWSHAEALVPESEADMPSYTQGLMDIGATVCAPRNPSCLVCPLSDGCQAYFQGRPEDFPVRTRTLVRKRQTWWIAVLVDGNGRVWLERRPAPGIWAGLYCPPVFDDEAALAASALARGGQARETLPPMRHALTHRELILHPVRWHLPEDAPEACEGAWFAATGWAGLGLPAPIKILLNGLSECLA